MGGRRGSKEGGREGVGLTNYPTDYIDSVVVKIANEKKKKSNSCAGYSLL